MNRPSNSNFTEKEQYFCKPCNFWTDRLGNYIEQSRAGGLWIPSSSSVSCFKTAAFRVSVISILRASSSSCICCTLGLEKGFGFVTGWTFFHWIPFLSFSVLCWRDLGYLLKQHSKFWWFSTCTPHKKTVMSSSLMARFKLTGRFNQLNMRKTSWNGAFIKVAVIHLCISFKSSTLVSEYVSWSMSELPDCPKMYR